MTLQESLDIFQGLGWHKAAITDAPTLPLGTLEQQKLALAGLKTGELGEFVRNPNTGAPRWESYVAGNEKMMALFAIRLGVSPKRACELLTFDDDPKAAAKVLSSRGAEFATAFVTHAVRTGEFACPLTIIETVSACKLPVLNNPDYLVLWCEFVLEGANPARCLDHIKQSVVHIDSAIDDVISFALEQGLIDRVAAVSCAFTGLAEASRPGARKEWVQFLADELCVTDAELVEHASTITQVLSTGESVVVTVLGARLVQLVDAATACEVALLCLYAKTDKAIVSTLKVLSTQSDVGEDVVARVQELANSGKPAVAKVAQKVLAGWGLDIVVAPQMSRSFKWSDTPAVWESLPFGVAGTDLPGALDEFVAISSRYGSDVVVSLESERLLAATVAAAWSHDESVSSAVSVAEKVVAGFDGPQSLLQAHFADMLAHVGVLPCVLAQPSFVDRRILPVDLLERLRSYQAAGAVAQPSDLVLALCRLDTRGLDAAWFLAQLSEISVRVAGKKETASDIIAAYVRDPFHDPGEKFLKTPPSLRGLVSYFDRGLRRPTFLEFPLMGTTGFIPFCENPSSLAVANHVAYHHEPLPSGASFALLSEPTAHEAAVSAWQRGILRPENLRLESAPSSALSRRVEQMMQLAEEGLTPVVWRALDLMVQQAVSAPRLPAGAAELSQAMADLAPSVPAATAHRNAAQAPGLRALAARNGSSQAAVAARRAVELLPAMPEHTPETQPDTPTQGFEPLPPKKFHRSWAKNYQPKPMVSDELEVHCTITSDDVVVSLIHEEETYVVAYDRWVKLPSNRRLPALTSTGETVCLWWDSDKDMLVVTPRNVEEQDSSSRPPLPQSFLTVVMCYLNGKDTSRDAWGDIKQLCNKSLISPVDVQTSMRTLLKVSGFSPAKILKESDSFADVLHVWWPILTESLYQAAAAKTPPRWLGSVLGTINTNLDVLATATHHGLIPAEEWSGLHQLATIGKKTAALASAKQLREAIESCTST